jgi:hypothetical protein
MIGPGVDSIAEGRACRMLVVTTENVPGLHAVDRMVGTAVELEPI